MRSRVPGLPPSPQWGSAGDQEIVDITREDDLNCLTSYLPISLSLLIPFRSSRGEP
jgi:hypothetical protein